MKKELINITPENVKQAIELMEKDDPVICLAIDRGIKHGFKKGLLVGVCATCVSTFVALSVTYLILEMKSRKELKKFEKFVEEKGY